MSTNLPDILLLVVDCWRHDAFGVNGQSASPTPNLDKLASRAVVFEQAIAGGGWTRPSMSALLSSVHASRFGGPYTAYSQDRPSLSESLRDLGYETAGFTANPQVGTDFGFERGFDRFVETDTDGELPGLSWSDLKGAQRLLRLPIVHGFLRALGIDSRPPEITTPADQLCETALSWLGTPRSSPRFAWVHFMDAHWPYHVLRRQHSVADLAAIWQDLHLMNIVAEEHGHQQLSEDRLGRLKGLYLEAIRFIDEQIGVFVDRLQASGRWDSTVMVVTADHGEEFYEHGRWGHFQLYDESIRVPLIVRIPGAHSGQVIPTQVSLLDIAPSLIELAGGNAPREMKGGSFREACYGGSLPGREAYAEAIWPDTVRIAIRTEDYKYLYDDKHPKLPELYDLKGDPNETRNIYRPDDPISDRFDRLRTEHLQDPAMTAPGSNAPVEVGEDVEERLRALGYIG